VDPGVQSFESFTYADATDMTSGTITVWFYDTDGFAAVGNPFAAQWGLSILLEDADNPADFGAVEICDLPYSSGYYASEGVGDRLKPNDRFYSGLPGPRAIGWHRVDFEISETISRIRVDGVLADEVAAPGGEKNLRLRIMADSATAGGFGNWFTHPDGEDSWPAQPGLVLVDDIEFSAVLPNAQTRRLDFEVDNEIPDYDTIGEFMGPEAHNVTEMLGFVHLFETTDAQAHSGANAARFAGGFKPLRKVEFDLDDEVDEKTVLVNFYDLLGPNDDFDKVGGSIIVQSGTNPNHWIALEVWNAEYPFGGPVPNYYLTARPSPYGSGFFSGYFGDRSVGWHELKIELTADGSRMVLDGVENAAGDGVIEGPGLDDDPRLIIMADSASLGGFSSWTDSAMWTDPLSPELDVLTLEKAADYLYFDDIDLGEPARNAAVHWDLFR